VAALEHGCGDSVRVPQRGEDTGGPGTDAEPDGVGNVCLGVDVAP
jgi:hypothetical protein